EHVPAVVLVRQGVGDTGERPHSPAGQPILSENGRHPPFFPFHRRAVLHAQCSLDSFCALAFLFVSHPINPRSTSAIYVRATISHSNARRSSLVIAPLWSSQKWQVGQSAPVAASLAFFARL